MAQLPHIKNSQVAMSLAEPVTLNLFTAQLIPPAGIVVPSYLEQEIKSIGGLDKIDAVPELVRQKAKGHTRVFPGAFLDDTTIELSMKVNLNLMGKLNNDNVIYKMFKQWLRRLRDDRTGATSLKADCMGSMILDQHNRFGTIWRSLEFKHLLLKEVTGLSEANLESAEPVELEAQFVAEIHEVVLGG